MFQYKEWNLANFHINEAKRLFYFCDFLENFKAGFTLRRRIWKRSFISRVWPTVQVIRHENGAFRKIRSSNRRNLKTPAFHFMWMENILKMELFENDVVAIIMWFPSPSFPQTQIQTGRWLLRFFLNSSGEEWTKNIWCVFRASKTSVFKSSVLMWKVELKGGDGTIENGPLKVFFRQSITEDFRFSANCWLSILDI